ncbi:MAG: TRAP transporter TatT component family protein [Gemmatimonadota bacterium]
MSFGRHQPLPALLAVPLLFSLFGCSMKEVAVNALANSLSEDGTSVYLSDDDPLLVAEALPFSLKMMESLLQSTPEHEGLLIATASGFVQYTHAFVLRPAIAVEAEDYDTAREGRARSKKLFLRANRYAKRAVEVRHPGAAQGLIHDLEATLAEFDRDDVPAMYWLAISLGSAISVDKSDMSLVADLPIVHGLIERALELDESWNDGAIHERLIALRSAPGSDGTDGEARSEYHFRRAMELNGGRSIGPLVAMAESVCIQQQNIGRFRTLLQQAIEFDVTAYPELRLPNTLAQQHAAWLITREEELFFSTVAASR